MSGEKFRRGTLRGDFPGRRLGAVFTKLERMRFSGLGPGAAYAHVAARFVLLPQRGHAAEQDAFLQQHPEQRLQRSPTAGRAAIWPVFDIVAHETENEPDPIPFGGTLGCQARASTSPSD
jgi:hypothetical protein